MSKAVLFTELPYERPSLADIELSFSSLIKVFIEATSSDQQIEAMRAITGLRNKVDTMATIVSIRHSLNTQDEFYDQENNFMDEMLPHYEGLLNTYYQSLNDSVFKAELSLVFGRHLFDLIETKLKTFKPEVLTELQTENKLCSEYTKLLSGAKIFFDGEERNLSQMGPYTQSKSRETRILAQKAVTAFFEENESEFDRIFDELVKVRTLIANKLGFPSYALLGYARLNRTDYGRDQVALYRDQIHKVVVPLTQKLRKRQAKRLGLDALQYYDEPLDFLSGNATPKGAPAWMVGNASEMYNEMSPETAEFFSFMQSSGLMDLVAKPGKAPGGYCTFIPDIKSPFIFSNFNGTSDDVDVLTHEAGHAFQVYLSREHEVPEYVWPTLEACEIHSMGMEFLAWPWIERFFLEDTAKYRFAHLTGALLFLPYGAAVDEFQHIVYENPELSPKERKTKWREVEKRYLPHRDYSSNPFLERGGFWFRQGHIFSSPFYYIDYTLAQVSAFELWSKAQSDRESVWADYIGLCRTGGSKSYLDLLNVANLCNPFENGTIAKIMAPVEAWLEASDDSAF